MTNLANMLDHLPILLIGFLLLAGMAIMAFLGFLLRRQAGTRPKTAEEKDEGGSEAYIISAVLGLLALLMGFTFSLAVERFEGRRSLVLQEANAIGTSYLRSQALSEPHRTRMSNILVAYTDNRIALGTARPDQMHPMVATNDKLLNDLWSATLAAQDSVGASPFSVSLLSTVNEVIDMDSSRKAARQVRVPAEVFLVLWVYILVTAGVIGYARSATQGKILAGLLFALLTLSFMLILDIDRPARGGITEGQGPMLALRETLRQQAPGTFDVWRRPAAAAPTP